MPEPTAIKAWKTKWGYVTTDYLPPSSPQRSPLPPLPESKSGVRDDSEIAYSNRKYAEKSGNGSGQTEKIDQEELNRKKAAFDEEFPPDANADEIDEPEDNGFEEYDALGQPLAQSIMGRLGDRWAVDRTAAEDQITGKIYTAKRQEALKGVAGDHYLVREYGMRAIKDMMPLDQRGGLRVDNPLSAIYLRDAPDEGVQKLFGDLYEKKKTPAKFVDGQMFIVNSDKVIGKLNAIYGPKWTDPSPPKQPSKTYKSDIKPLYKSIEKLDTGFHVITMTKVLTSEERDIFEGKMLYGVGATPSSYQAVKLVAAPAKPPLTDPALLSATSLGNVGKLDQAMASKGAKTMTSLPGDHPLKTTAAAAVKMVEGLKAALAEKVLKESGDAFDKNKLVGAALDNINQLLEAMPTYMDDIPRFARLFDLLVDEVHLVLATSKPYGKDKFREASAKMITDRAPDLSTIPNVKNTTYMLSSGMDTMSTAVSAAMATTKTGDVNLLDQNASGGGRSGNYFEVQMHLLGQGKLAGTGPLIMGTLNPSTPTTAIDSATAEGWTVKKLIEEIDKRVQALKPGPTETAPAVVIVDVTVEKETEKAADQEINQVIAKFKDLINDKKMQLMLSKSYQKFPSLGSGKAMSGGLTVIGKGAKCDELMNTVGAAETSAGFLDNDETQLVTHFMTHEADMERPMLKRAAKNAKFLRGLMPAKVENKDAFSYDEGLPFLVANGERIAFDLPGDPPYQAKKKSVPAQYLAYPMGVERRFSFGFQNSSCLPIGSAGANTMVRIGAGQESEGELVEKFYALTRLTAAAPPPQRGVEPPPVTADTIGGYAREAAGKAFDELAPILTKYQKETDLPKKDEGRKQTVAELVAAGLIKAGDVDRDNKTGKVTKIQTGRAAIEDAIKAGKIKAAQVERVDGAPAKLNTPASVAAIRKMIVDGLIKDTDVKIGKGFVTLNGANAPEAIDAKIAQTLLDLKTGKGLTKEAAMAAKFALVSSATAPQLTDANRQLDDVNLMHASVGTAWKDNRSSADKEKEPLPAQGTEAKYLPNIVASCALTTASVFTRPEDAKAFTDLADPLIANGLDQLSPEMREKLLGARVKTIFKGGVGEIKGGAKKIAECVDKMPYREGGANLLKGPELARALWKGALPKKEQEALSDDCAQACTGKLDLQSKLDLLKELTRSATDAKANVAASRLPASTARAEATGAQDIAAQRRREVPTGVSARNPTYMAKNKIANAAEALARKAEAKAVELERIRDDLEQRQAVHPTLAKSCAKQLKAEIEQASRAFDDKIATDERPEPPLSPAKIGDIPLGKGAPAPISPELFKKMETQAKEAIEAANNL